MSKELKIPPRKYHPPGFEIIYEDLDLIVGIKKPGYLTVAAKWNRDKTIHSGLNTYIKKGNARSNKEVFVVHRLDQATSGLLIFAKSEEAQQYLKNNWKSFSKKYYTIVHGHLKKKSGLIESYLEEDEEYFVKSTQDRAKGELAKTEYKVLQESKTMSLLEINLLTGKKNQIRVHMSELGHSIIGDTKYGPAKQKFNQLMLHSYSLELTHPHSKEKIKFTARVPELFQKLFKYSY